MMVPSGAGGSIAAGVPRIVLHNTVADSLRATDVTVVAGDAGGASEAFDLEGPAATYEIYLSKDYCRPGQGGATCQACARGTYSAPLSPSAPKPDCLPCPANTTASSRARAPACAQVRARVGRAARAKYSCALCVGLTSRWPWLCLRARLPACLGVVCTTSERHKPCTFLRAQSPSASRAGAAPTAAPAPLASSRQAAPPPTPPPSAPTARPASIAWWRAPRAPSSAQGRAERPGLGPHCCGCAPPRRECRAALGRFASIMGRDNQGCLAWLAPLDLCLSGVWHLGTRLKARDIR